MYKRNQNNNKENLYMEKNDYFTKTKKNLNNFTLKFKYNENSIKSNSLINEENLFNKEMQECYSLNLTLKSQINICEKKDFFYLKKFLVKIFPILNKILEIFFIALIFFIIFFVFHFIENENKKFDIILFFGNLLFLNLVYLLRKEFMQIQISKKLYFKIIRKLQKKNFFNLSYFMENLMQNKVNNSKEARNFKIKEYIFIILSEDKNIGCVKNEINEDIIYLIRN